MRLGLSLVCLALISLLQSAGIRSPDAAQGPPRTPANEARERAYRSNNIGVAHLEQFDYKGAEDSFREALELHSELALSRLNLAIALLYSGRPADAVAAAADAAKRLPDTANAHYVLGLAARGQDDLATAVAAFGRVLAIDAEDAGAKIQLGQIHLQQRRYAEALTLFQDALAAEPYNVTAAYSVALALTRSGKPDEGRAAMQRFETLRDSPYGFTYAQTYLSQGKYAEAIASTGAEADLVSAGMPEVTFSDATGRMLPAARPLSGPGAMALLDVDDDGDLDVVETDGAGVRFLRNGGGTFTDDTAKAGLIVPPADLPVRVVLSGDFDNDGRLDLFFAGGSYRLFRQRADGAFDEVTAKAGFAGPPPAGVRTAAAADIDHDGDLDVLAGGTPAQLLRNNGDGTFSEIAAAAGLAVVGAASTIAATDFDNRRDIDIVAAEASGPALFRNMRDGTFRNATADAGLPPKGQFAAALAVGDVNKDGYTDFFFGRAGQPGLLSLSDGRMRFRTGPAPQATGDAAVAQFLDYDNDGLLDLLTLGRGSLRLHRNTGGGWVDATERARLPAAGTAAPADGVESLALGDLDGDGDTDLVVRSGAGLRVLANDGGAGNGSIRVRLAARVSNRTGVGSKVEVRAGSLRQMLETSSSSPAVAPADLVFGLGPRPAADVLRVLWPSGILQAETELKPAAAADGRAPITVTELDRKPSSCPYLFTWNGTRFEFVTDVMGGGEMGGWLAPAVWNQPDPDEYVRIGAGQLRPRDGRYELRLTNELEEALFFDRAQLVVLDHDETVDVYPNEGLRSAPRPPFAVTAVRSARPPVRAIDDRGTDVLPALTSIDRRYPDSFRTLPIRGYAEPHELILDLGAVSERPVLLMTGWTDYAFSNDNVAASQRQVALQPPQLDVRDAQGNWRTVIAEVGFPVGRPQTVTVDLRGKFLSDSREVRIRTNMRIYWDRILVGESGPGAAVRLTRLDPVAADLRWRGISAEITPDGREPYAYDYHRVSTRLPWKTMVGAYTREGDVRQLMRQVDDMFVISQPGDELALSFRAPPPVAPGHRRTFFLFVHGYSKEMNPRSAVPETVAPLPFRAMTAYPYGEGEQYPQTERHRRYRERYNQRLVSRPLPSIDRALIEERR